MRVRAAARRWVLVHGLGQRQVSGCWDLGVPRAPRAAPRAPRPAAHAPLAPLPPRSPRLPPPALPGKLREGMDAPTRCPPASLLPGCPHLSNYPHMPQRSWTPWPYHLPDLPRPPPPHTCTRTCTCTCTHAPTYTHTRTTESKKQTQARTSSTVPPTAHPIPHTVPSRCLQLDPSTRPSASELLHHPFLAAAQ